MWRSGALSTPSKWLRLGVETRWCERPGPGGSRVRDGPLQSWHADRRSALLGAYRDGLPDGPWRSFYRSGERKFEAHYAAGHPVGEWRGWYRSGVQSHRLLFLRGAIDAAESRAESGQLLRREFYEGGVLHGPYTKHIPGRDLWIYGTHRRGAPDGIERWYRGERLELWFSYCAGRLHGPHFAFHPSGRLRMAGHFRDDARVGTWIRYEPSGTVAAERHYTDLDPARQPARCESRDAPRSEPADAPAHAQPNAARSR